MDKLQSFRLTPQSAIALVLLANLVILIASFASYGFTIDDVNGVIRATRTFAFLATGGAENAAASDFSLTNFYGAMADLLALLLQKLFPALVFDSRHLVSGLFGLVGIFFTYRLGERLGGRWVGVVAALLLSLNPMWSGYMLINIKDVPFAAMLLASLFYFLTILTDDATPGWRSWLGLGLSAGLLATTKLPGLLVLGLAALVLVVFMILARGRIDPGRLFLRGLLSGVTVVVGCAVTAVFFWPQLYLFSPAQLYTVVVTFLDYTPWGGKVLLDGVVYPFDEVPRSYVLFYFVISMPLFLTALILAAVPAVIVKRRVEMLGVLLVPVVFMALQAYTHAQVYNGYRHFLFLIPFMMIAAAYALVTLGNIGQSVGLRAAAVAAITAFAVLSIGSMATMFPYQYSTYNALVGGTEGAQGRFYIDVWRSAEREALQLLERRVDPEATYRVLACGSLLNFEDHPRFERIGDPVWADFIIALPRGCPPSDFPGYRTVAEVRRGDVVFATVLSPQ